MNYKYKTRGTCAREIEFDVEKNEIHNVKFTGGCNGNLKAISTLVEGQDIEKVKNLLKGIDCQGRGTSCADQLSIAIDNINKKEL